MANQVASGLALTLFGLGLSALLGQAYVGISPPRTPKLDLGPLSDIPFFGRAFFSHDALVYLAIAIVIGVWWFLKYSRAGLILRAVGENHDAAHGLGYHVKRVRALAIVFGGACAGLGGAYLSLIRVPQWTEGMTAGAGWIALALVVFASWRPFRALAGAYLFGGIVVFATESASGGRQDTRRILVNVALPDNHRCACFHLVGQSARVAERTRIAEPAFPCLGLRQLAAKTGRNT